MGGEKLIYGGFIYTKCKDGKDKRYWRCENWKSDKCHGTATTDNNNSVTVGQEHNHGPSPTRVELARIKNNINKAAINSTLSPRAVVNSQLAGISDKAKASLPKLKNLEKTVGRKRYASGEPNPYNLARALLDEQVRVDAISVKILSGEEIPLFSKQQYQRANERLLNVLRGQAMINPIEYLTACSHYIQF
ncbi:unnamed protein product [Meloidogyne enterolobii]|uniref:Uncharacterized protein n=1 Tax=Meloidogyne enterolobii TaxID=390850 RepID=A0ACB1A8D3_MELEN